MPRRIGPGPPSCARTLSSPPPSSVVITSKPSDSRRPSLFTPVAITTATFTTRPPSCTFWVSASSEM